MDLSKAVRDPWVWGQTILGLIVLLLAPFLPRYVNLDGLDYLLNRVDPDWIRWLGCVPLVAGVAVLVYGASSLGRNLTPGVEPLPEGQLVTSGAYTHVRHPMYAGIVLLLTGYTLIWSNWTLALLVGAVARLYFDAKARAEERWLLKRFAGYESYMRHVRRRVL